jgi:hypothetical protein
MGRNKMTTAERIRAYYEKHPDAKPRDVAKALGVNAAYVYLVRSKMKREVPFDAFAPVPLKVEGGVIDEKWKVVTMNTTADPVNHPPHYKTGGIETIDFIEAKELNYRLGNVIKYITRSDHKGNRAEDLKKALWYLQREIEKA